MARTGEFKLDRIPFDTILEVAIRTNSDGSGGIFYSLKAPKNTKAMYDIEVSDVSKVRDALPSNQIRLIDYSATKGN